MHFFQGHVNMFTQGKIHVKKIHEFNLEKHITNSKMMFMFFLNNA